MSSSVVADRRFSVNRPQTQRDDDSSERIDSVDSSLVSSSSESSGARGGQSDEARPAMSGSRVDSPENVHRPESQLTLLKQEWRATLPMKAERASEKRSSVPSLIVRTYSVRRGRKSEYRVESVASDEIVERRIDDRKSLRRHVAHLMARHPEILVDLSYNWQTLDQAIGARSAVATALLVGGSDKQLCIDLSNCRVRDLREGAATRYQLGMTRKAWLRAVVDAEAPALVVALGRELARVAREQSAMPVFSLVCHDQPLGTVINPLLKQLARHGAALTGFDRLDLNRYSRSAEVSEARPLAQVAHSDRDRFVIRLGVLLAMTPALRELCLRMNSLDSHDLATLVFSKNHTLERLDLSSNPLCLRIDDGRRSLRGVTELARHLSDEPRLIELDLSACGLDGDAASQLAKGLRHNQRLQKLNLSGNPIPADHTIFRDERVQSNIAER